MPVLMRAFVQIHGQLWSQTVPPCRIHSFLRLTDDCDDDEQDTRYVGEK